MMNQGATHVAQTQVHLSVDTLHTQNTWLHHHYIANKDQQLSRYGIELYHWVAFIFANRTWGGPAKRGGTSAAVLLKDY